MFVHFYGRYFFVCAVMVIWWNLARVSLTLAQVLRHWAELNTTLVCLFLLFLKHTNQQKENMPLFKKKNLPRWLIPALGRQRQADFCEFEASLFYKVSSRTGSIATEKSCLQKTNKKINELSQYILWYLKDHRKKSIRIFTFANQNQIFTLLLLI